MYPPEGGCDTLSRAERRDVTRLDTHAASAPRYLSGVYSHSKDLKHLTNSRTTMGRPPPTPAVGWRWVFTWFESSLVCIVRHVVSTSSSCPCVLAQCVWGGGLAPGSDVHGGCRLAAVVDVSSARSSSSSPLARNFLSTMSSSENLWTSRRSRCAGPGIGLWEEGQVGVTAWAGRRPWCPESGPPPSLPTGAHPEPQVPQPQ